MGMGMQLTGKGSLVASSLTAIGASVCCVGPLVLLALGVGGTWVGALTMMGSLQNSEIKAR
ncbi:MULTISPECIES: mercuric transporter MerT family protein [Gammaproteobacteria]|nr:Mercuric transport protein [Pseudomonas aeruginosa]